MFDAPIDVWYVYAAIATVSCATLGVAVGLPTGVAPDASAAARAVDHVASTPHAAQARHPLDADAVRLRRDGLALRGSGGTTRGTFGYGPVTPVGRDSPLRTVLEGTSPSRVFASVASFRRAVETARTRTPRWQPAGDRLVVRTLGWGGVHVTLVGA